MHRRLTKLNVKGWQVNDKFKLKKFKNQVAVYILTYSIKSMYMQVALQLGNVTYILGTLIHIFYPWCDLHAHMDTPFRLLRDAKA